MRFAKEQPRTLSASTSDEGGLSVFGESLRRAPSQKELATVFRVTARHLRRWEESEAAANRPCSRPYTHADLWRLYERRGRKGWDRAFAMRLGLSDVFERFDQMRGGDVGHGLEGDQFTIATMMLRSVASGGCSAGAEPISLPQMFGAGLAEAAKAQLRLIVSCPDARLILVKAFFEAALIADAKRLPVPAEPNLPGALSA